MNPAPPEYQANGDLGLPSYNFNARPAFVRSPTEHTYHLTGGKSKPWATLKVQSAAQSAESIPVFLEGNVMNGLFELSLDKPDHIVEVGIVVVGRVITSVDDYDSGIFLSLSQIIWSRSMGDPRAPSASVSGASFSEKLRGDYSWPFTLTLPRDVTLLPKSNNKGPAETFFLPPTFLERSTKASIQYDIHAEVRRGRFRADSKIGTIFHYVPCVKPDPPSSLRRIAYQKDTPIPGPDADPDGWKTLEPTDIKGTIFNDREVRAKCILSLARPLCYTRGTVIPCVMIIETSDQQALDLLSSPRAVVVRLQRRIIYSTELASHHTNKDPVLQTTDDYPASAVWWPSFDGGGYRRLDGEIQLSRYLKPSFAVSHFSLSYNVVILPFEAIAYNSTDQGPLLTQKVEIGTLFADGPRPKNYSPPTYSDPTSKTSDFTIGAQGAWT